MLKTIAAGLTLAAIVVGVLVLSWAFTNVVTRPLMMPNAHTCTKTYTAADGSRLSITWDDPRVCKSPGNERH